jgi:hypothetical protein
VARGPDRRLTSVRPASAAVRVARLRAGIALFGSMRVASAAPGLDRLTPPRMRIEIPMPDVLVRERSSSIAAGTSHAGDRLIGVDPTGGWTNGMTSEVSGNAGDKLIVVEVWESQTDGRPCTTRLAPAFARADVPQTAPGTIPRARPGSTTGSLAVVRATTGPTTGADRISPGSSFTDPDGNTTARSQTIRPRGRPMRPVARSTRTT